jgi:RNA 2',3'-cyclic 3'-phosphodiesterase
VPGNLRLFVALTLEPSESERLAAWAAEALEARGGLRLVPAANLHVTLAFCGAVAEERVGEVVAHAREATAGLPSPVLHPVGVHAFGLAVVGVAHRIEGEAEAERWSAAVVRLRSALTHAGLARPDDRPFRPHVTVARARRGVRVRVGGIEPPSGDLGPSGVAVYASLPVPGGVRYQPLAHIGFDARRPGTTSPQGG